MSKNNLVNVEINKIGLNPDSKFAILQNDFSIVDSHPNIKKGSGRIGTVRIEDLIPRLGYHYAVSYALKQFYTSEIIKVINLFTFMTKNSIYQINVLDRLINYQYTVEYREITTFDFNKKNVLVDLSNYQTLETEIPRIVNILKTDNNSRKALIVLADNIEPSCLISLQFLIDKEHLTCLANYRSQHMTLGCPHDIRLLNYLTTSFINLFEKKFEKISIIVTVADFHNYNVAD